MKQVDEKILQQKEDDPRDKDRKLILKVLVGSRAHGLAKPLSDYDYRGVYVLPTAKILSLGYNYKGTEWLEGKNDNTAYEIGHFLFLATKCNPTILETFKAPIIEATKDGEELRKLFPCVWTPKQTFDAFVGYGLNQRKKFLDKKDKRENKYAVAYIRTLYNLKELLDTGDFKVEIPEGKFKKDLRKFRDGLYSLGDVINYAEVFVLMCEDSLKKCEHKPNLEKVNEFLIKIRRKYF